MKTKIIAVAVLFSTLFIGCKNEKTEDAKNQPEQQQVDEGGFKVVLDVLLKKDDDLQVYYNTGDGIKEEHSVWNAVKGTGASQKVVFELPEDALPNSLRIDLGVNDAQEDIVLNGVELNYSGKHLEIKGADLGKFFYPLEGTEVDFATGTVKAKQKDGKRVEPALYSQDAALEVEINKILK